MDKPFFDKRVQLKKFSGKGGWTYLPLAGVSMDKDLPFGMKRVKGSIDDFEIYQCHLMPLGNQQLFLPVKAAIRKKIKKEEGDWVSVILYDDDSPIEAPREFLDCIKDDNLAYQRFLSLTDGVKKRYIDWIYSAKTEDAKIERMARAINDIASGKKL